jgi:SAM-dependent methyltransferase
LSDPAAVPTVPVHACPACGGGAPAVARAGGRDLRFGVPGRWSFRRCRECGVIYLTPRPAVLADAYPDAYTQHRPPAPPTPLDPRAPLRHPRVWFRRWLLGAYGYREFAVARPLLRLGRVAMLLPGVRLRAKRGFHLLPPPLEGGRLLDVGCGNGRFLALVRALGWRAEGVEPDPRSAAVARRVSGAEVHASLAEGGFPAESFDVVTMNHVLEHVADPVATLAECRRLLKPAGRLGVAVPNWSSLGHRVFGEHWHALEPPRHLLMFDRRALAGLLGRAGFAVESIATTSVRSERMSFPTSWSSRFGAPPPAPFARLWELLGAAADAVHPDLGGEIVAWARKAPGPPRR